MFDALPTVMRTTSLVGALVAMLAPSAFADPVNTLGEVHFKFDSAVLPGEAPALLRDAVNYATAHPDTRIVLDAHCDPIGTSPYNVGLAIRRAESVRAQLTAMGVPEAQVVFSIYGKDGAPRASYAADRRVAVWPTHEPLASVIDQTFAGHGTAVTWAQPLTVAQIDAAPAPVASR